MPKEYYEAHRAHYLARAAEARTWYRWHCLMGCQAGWRYWLSELIEALVRLLMARRLFYARPT